MAPARAGGLLRARAPQGTPWPAATTGHRRTVAAGPAIGWLGAGGEQESLRQVASPGLTQPGGTQVASRQH